MELKPIRTDGQPVGRGVTYDAAEIAASEQGRKVLRNTYLLLALTMVPTVIGAFVGMASAGVIMANPIISTLVMLGAVIGLQFGIAANRNSGICIALLIAMLANMWLQIPALALTISTLVIVVFSLFLLYDLSRIVRGGETNYVMATTGVYLSLFNIFANLLQILLALAGEKD